MTRILYELFSSLIILVYLKATISLPNSPYQANLYLKALEKHQVHQTHDHKVSGIPAQTWSIQRSSPTKTDSLAQLSSVIIQDRSDNRLAITEPGFDLTDEEIKKFKIWPLGIIPYFIDDFSYDKGLRDRIRSFLDVISGVTGLHFIELPKPPEDADERWVFFVNRRGQLDCDEHTTKSFTNRGVQKVVLGYDCMSSSGELAEAVLALVGVPPQHNSPNRDNFIRINKNNTLPDKVHLFEKISNTEWLFHDINSYDWYSAGHYHWHKYTKNGGATIMPSVPIDFPVGEGNGFSYTDIWKIRMLYNFISKKKTIKAPDCHKMFVPGKNFSSYKTESEDEIEPRKKPNKYLGLPDDQPDKPKKYNEIQNNDDIMKEETHKNKTQVDNNTKEDETQHKTYNQSTGNHNENKDIKNKRYNVASSESDGNLKQNENSRLESGQDGN